MGKRVLGTQAGKPEFGVPGKFWGNLSTVTPALTGTDSKRPNLKELWQGTQCPLLHSHEYAQVCEHTHTPPFSPVLSHPCLVLTYIIHILAYWASNITLSDTLDYPDFNNISDM